jgi:hypothetical protein
MALMAPLRAIARKRGRQLRRPQSAVRPVIQAS